MCYLNGSCSTKRSPRSPTLGERLALGLHDQRMQLSLSSSKIQKCWAVFLRLLAPVLGFFCFFPRMLLSPSQLSVLCCSGIPRCRLAARKPGFVLGFHCSLICCVLAAASCPSLLPHPAGSPLTASYGNGELLSLWQVHRFYIQEQLFKLFPLTKRFKF